MIHTATEPTHETVSGQRLQVTCRALGLAYADVGEWVKNSNRHYPDRFRVTGVKLTVTDAATLRAHLEAKAAKAEALRARRSAPGYWEAKRATAAKRAAKELAAITASVNDRWALDAGDVAAFAEHANEPGEGRVLRTKTACRADFDTKVYMALVAWVRHNKTSYEADLRAANGEAWSEANSMRPYFDAGESWGDYSEEDRWDYDDARDEAKAQCQRNRDRLHAQYTAEAVAWLEARTTLVAGREVSTLVGGSPVLSTVAA